MEFEWAGNVASQVLQWLFNSAIDLIMPFLEVTCGLNTEIWRVTLIADGIRYAQVLATSVLVVKVIYEMIVTYGLHKGEDPLTNPAKKILSTIIAVAVIWAIPELVKYAALFGNNVVSDIGVINSDSFDKLKGVGSADSLLFIAINNYNPNGMLFELIMVFVLIVIYFKISFQLIKRSVELLLFAIIGPFFALSLTKDDFSPIKEWGKKLFLLCTTHAVQIFLFRLSLTMLYGGPSAYQKYFKSGLNYAFDQLPTIGLYLFVVAIAIFATTVQGFIGKLLDSANAGGGGSALQKAYTVAQIGRAFGKK